jgi:hypothetical protein
MLKTWFDLTLNAAFLGMETQRVVGLRLMKLAAGGAAAQTEAQLMVTEKVAAFAEAATTLATGGPALSRSLRDYQEFCVWPVGCR